MLSLFGDIPDYVLVRINGEELVVKTSDIGKLSDVLLGDLSRGRKVHKVELDINHDGEDGNSFILATTEMPLIQIEIFKTENIPIIDPKEALEARMSWLLNNSTITWDDIKERAISDLQRYCKMDLNTIDITKFDSPDLGEESSPPSEPMSEEDEFKELMKEEEK